MLNVLDILKDHPCQFRGSSALFKALFFSDVAICALTINLVVWRLISVRNKPSCGEGLTGSNDSTILKKAYLNFVFH